MIAVFRFSFCLAEPAAGACRRLQAQVFESVRYDSCTRTARAALFSGIPRSADTGGNFAHYPPHPTYNCAVLGGGGREWKKISLL